MTFKDNAESHDYTVGTIASINYKRHKPTCLHKTWKGTLMFIDNAKYRINRQITKKRKNHKYTEL